MLALGPLFTLSLTALVFTHVDGVPVNTSRPSKGKSKVSPLQTSPPSSLSRSSSPSPQPTWSRRLGLLRESRPSRPGPGAASTVSFKKEDKGKKAAEASSSGQGQQRDKDVGLLPLKKRPVTGQKIAAVDQGGDSSATSKSWSPSTASSTSSPPPSPPSSPSPPSHPSTSATPFVRTSSTVMNKKKFAGMLEQHGLRDISHFKDGKELEEKTRSIYDHFKDFSHPLRRNFIYHADHFRQVGASDEFQQEFRRSRREFDRAKRLPQDYKRTMMTPKMRRADDKRFLNRLNLHGLSYDKENLSKPPEKYEERARVMSKYYEQHRQPFRVVDGFHRRTMNHENVSPSFQTGFFTSRRKFLKGQTKTRVKKKNVDAKLELRPNQSLKPFRGKRNAWASWSKSGADTTSSTSNSHELSVLLGGSSSHSGSGHGFNIWSSSDSSAKSVHSPHGSTPSSSTFASTSPSAQSKPTSQTGPSEHVDPDKASDPASALAHHNIPDLNLPPPVHTEGGASSGNALPADLTWAKKRTRGTLGGGHRPLVRGGG